MIASWVLCAVLSLTFHEQEIAGLSAGEINPLNGQVAAHFRHADLNADGLMDLILPAEVLFQTADDGFVRDNAGALPEADAGPSCDVAQGALYLCLPERLKIVRWTGSAWETTLDQTIQWPLTVWEAYSDRAPGQETPGVRFQRFLTDFEGDGPPEIAVPAVDGIHVYRMQGKKYGEAAVLDVFPPLTMSHSGGRALWPPEERRFAFPTRQMNCQFSISGNIVTVLNREDLPEMTVRYRVTRHTVDPAQGYRIDASKFQTSTTDPMPGYVRPCRIDNDDRVDFAGGDWEFEQTSVMPAPVYETYVTLDGGRSDQRIRTRSLRPHCSFLDFDGDGDLDRVTESTGLYDGGVRESISRFLTSRDVVHEIQVWFQDARGQFSETPSVSGRFTVRLDAPPVGNSAFFRRYLAAELFNLTGDFNGDGYRDLVVWERPRQLAVYLSSGAGFETTPAATLTVPEESRFSIADIDQDRLSDIVVQPDGGADTALVYFAEEDAP